MPPIPVHIDDPITPSKALGVTPQTADQQPTRTTNTDAGVTTAVAGSGSSYIPAQPGAAAVPAPTPFAQPVPTRTLPASSNNDGPPPPQPGAVPVPPSATATATAPSSIPPPPKAAEMPRQMSIPTPSQNLAPTHSTTTATTASGARGPTTLNLGPVGGTIPTASSAHPSGYQQNVFAQEMSSAQRASLDAQEAEDRRGSFLGDLGGVGGGAGGVLGGGSSGNEEGSMWNSAKGWLGAAGTKAAEIEGEVWRRVNGGK